MLAADEREVLGSGQRETRCQEPLRRRIAREIEEQRGPLERARALEARAEELRAVVRHADSREHDGEVFSFPGRRRAAQARVGRDLDREPVVRQSAAGEQRQLLPAHEAVHQVQGRDAGLDEIARTRACNRIDRQPVDGVGLACRDRRPAVDHLSDAVEDAAENAR